MSFKSEAFLIFFPLVATLYYLLAPRFRWILLLVASCYFYMSFYPAYIFILFFLIFIDYSAGLLMEGRTGYQRRLVLIMSCVANIGILVYYKYFNLFNETLRAAFNWMQMPYPIPYLHILLPLGLSFHIFQSMSYTFEVYYGRYQPERHLGLYALYVMYFPQLVAGPIERPRNLLPHLSALPDFNYTRAVSGLRLMLWGFFKKIVIADRLAVLVNTVYNAPQIHAGAPLWLATFFFAFQIYYDFSGYTDIAIGSSRMLGIDLMKNFNNPYFADSIQKFWQRWHISLSTWFRDYLYKPLGGNEEGLAKWVRNILIVFVVSGLWHGAKWTFVLWGLYHAFLYFLYWGMQGFQWMKSKMLRVGITFTLTALGWIFFRANSLADCGYIWRHLFDFSQTSVLIQRLSTRGQTEILLGLSKAGILLSFALIVFAEYVHAGREKGMVQSVIARTPRGARWFVYAAAVWAILLLGNYNYSEFIYFAF